MVYKENYNKYICMFDSVHWHYSPEDGNVKDGAISEPDVEYQSDTATVRASWSGFDDPESGHKQGVWNVFRTPAGSYRLSTCDKCHHYYWMSYYGGVCLCACVRACVWRGVCVYLCWRMCVSGEACTEGYVCGGASMCINVWECMSVEL